MTEAVEAILERNKRVEADKAWETLEDPPRGDCRFDLSGRKFLHDVAGRIATVPERADPHRRLPVFNPLFADGEEGMDGGTVQKQIAPASYWDKPA